MVSSNVINLYVPAQFVWTIFRESLSILSYTFFLYILLVIFLYPLSNRIVNHIKQSEDHCAIMNSMILSMAIFGFEYSAVILRDWLTNTSTNPSLPCYLTHICRVTVLVAYKYYLFYQISLLCNDSILHFIFRASTLFNIISQGSRYAQGRVLVFKCLWWIKSYMRKRGCDRE